LFNNNAVAIDSIENFSEKWLFDAFNILRERNAWTLFLAKSPPQHIILPDLRSRMMSVPSFELGRPDDDLIKGVLIKRLKDFGLLIDDDTLMYLLNRIPRSLAAANEWAERLSTNSAITQRRISKRLVQALLAI
jgi:chromosomal replication initiation ATPase DnaA